MQKDSGLDTLIDLIYEAALDSHLWPSVLIGLADRMGSAQVSMTSRNLQAGTFASLAPRTDPALIAAYRNYWRFHNPLWQKTTAWRAGEFYTLDELIPREEYAALPVYNEWWKPSGRGLAAGGANLVIEENFSVLAYMVNAPDVDALTERQIQIFKAALPHLRRSIRLNRQLWQSEMKSLLMPERVASLSEATLLVDAASRVICTNEAAEALLDDRDGLFVENGYLAAAGQPNRLQHLIASCVSHFTSPNGPGGEILVLRTAQRTPLRVTVTPLRAKAQLAEVPWAGIGALAAIVTVRDPDLDQRRKERHLRHRFGLTEAESRLAAEIIKGDGRGAAAKRRGISGATAKSQLSKIFEKTGTHRQAELIRLLLASGEKAPKS
ncbi:MAG TPA: helix-turn-helix transcriptional regulator [Methylocella sp.]|nr:helix-turn-helix transcriptional regulator [Methylocella sp.]